jgi:hypothetical protein
MPCRRKGERPVGGPTALGMGVMEVQKLEAELASAGKLLSSRGRRLATQCPESAFILPAEYGSVDGLLGSSATVRRYSR